MKKALFLLIATVFVVSTTLMLFVLPREENSDEVERTHAPTSTRDMITPSSLPLSTTARIPRVDLPPQAQERPQTSGRNTETVITASHGHRFRVEDPSGLPVAGARVHLFHPHHLDPAEKGVTRADGTLHLRAAAPGDRIEAEADGFSKSHLILGSLPWPSPYPIPLERGALFLEGMVLDDRGVPVEKVRIEATLKGRKERSITHSGRGGCFSLSLPGDSAFPLELILFVRSDPYCFLGDEVPITVPSPEDLKRPVTLTVYRCAKLEVTVMDEAGGPVSSARVKLGGPPNVPDRFHLPGDRWLSEWLPVRTRPSASGPKGGESGDPCSSASVCLENIPPLLPLWIRVDGFGYESVDRELQPPLRPGEKREVTIHLTPTGRPGKVTFHVTDPAGRSLEECSVVIFNEQGEVTGNPHKSYYQTDGDGRVKVSLDSERIRVMVHRKGFLPFRETYDTSLLGTGTVEITLQPGGGRISVQVLDPRGRGVEGIILFVNEAGDWSRSLFSTSVHTGPDGRAEAAGLDPAGTYTVKFFPLEFFSQDLVEKNPQLRDLAPSPPCFPRVRSGEALTIHLVPCAVLEGRMLDPRFAGKILSLCLVNENPFEDHPHPLYTVSCTVDKKGAFYFRRLPPGLYRMWCRELEEDEGPYGEWRLRAGERLTGLEVRGP